VGHSLSLLTAALLVGQTPVYQSQGKSCSCNKATQGYITAQPDYVWETQPVGWVKRGSSSTSEWRSSSEWHGQTSEASWIDNRPVLSRMRNWFNRNDNAPSRTEPSSAQPVIGQPVIVSPNGSGQEYYRRLPTTNEPPLNVTPAQPAGRSERISPASRPMPVAPAPQPGRPLTIEVEPIQFRPAGAAPMTVAPAPASSQAASTRPNPISARFTNKVGQPGDYSWITGQLEVRNGMAIVHYATPETVDRYNGSLVLATDADLSRLRSGDLVSVHGAVEQRGSSIVYRVQTMDLIER